MRDITFSAKADLSEGNVKKRLLKNLYQPLTPGGTTGLGPSLILTTVSVGNGIE